MSEISTDAFCVGLCAGLESARDTGVSAVIDAAQALVTSGNCICAAADVKMGLTLILLGFTVFKILMN